MIKLYFISAWRNNRKRWSFLQINIPRLAVSVAICLLMILIINDQKSYDRFHAKANRIYRINTVSRSMEMGMHPMASSALPPAGELQLQFSLVEHAVLLVKHIGGDVFYKDRFASGGGYFADEKLFQVFDFKLRSGDEATALKEPFSLLIDEAMNQQLRLNKCFVFM